MPGVQRILWHGDDPENRIVGFLAAPRQASRAPAIVYLLGPVGGVTISLAERLKALMQNLSDLALKAGDLGQVFESPLRLFDRNAWNGVAGRATRHSRRRLNG